VKRRGGDTGFESDPWWTIELLSKR